MALSLCSSRIPEVVSVVVVLGLDIEALRVVVAAMRPRLAESPLGALHGAGGPGGLKVLPNSGFHDPRLNATGRIAAPTRDRATATMPSPAPGNCVTLDALPHNEPARLVLFGLALGAQSDDDVDRIGRAVVVHVAVNYREAVP